MEPDFAEKIDAAYRRAEKLANEVLGKKDVIDFDQAIEKLGCAIQLLEAVIEVRGPEDDLCIERAIWRAEQKKLEMKDYENQKRFLKAYRAADEGLTIVANISNTLEAKAEIGEESRAKDRASELTLMFYNKRDENFKCIECESDQKTYLQNNIDLWEQRLRNAVAKGNGQMADRIGDKVQKMKKDLTNLMISEEENEKTDMP